MERHLLAFVFFSISRYVCSQTPTPGLYQHQMPNRLQQTIAIGPCRIVLNPQCPDPDVTFFMYSVAHPDSPEPIYIATHVRGTNLATTSFDPAKPSKVIIHGYNSNMFLSALTALRKEYLKTNDYNIFVVDWSPLNRSPCYPAAVWNARHVGTCTAQLLDRIRDMGAVDIHVIGFSLGAHITNYLSLAIQPYRIPRITGLDPALPGYITSDNDEKLDKSDAEFVDVYHTNAFMQGKAEESGHVDFYFNGGSFQPGCWASENIFACSHHRAPIYYAESINSNAGFWGWRCISYFDYLIGRCPPNEYQVLLGERVRKDVFGTHMVVTSSFPPFAIGPYNTSVSPFKIKFTRPLEFVDNNLGDIKLTFPDVPMLDRYHQEVVQPSAVEEHEMFSEVLKENFSNEAGIKSEMIDSDFGVFQNGREIIDNELK